MEDASRLIKIKEVLKKRGIINEEMSQSIESQDFASMVDFFDFLVKQLSIDEDRIYPELSAICGLPYIDLRTKEIPDRVLSIVQRSVAQNYKLIAFDLTDRELSVGLVNPYDFQAIRAVDFLAKQKKIKSKLYLISSESFEAGMGQYSDFDSEVKEAIALVEQEKEQKVFKASGGKKDEEAEFEEIISETPVSKIVSMIIKKAVESRASDIHIEPTGEGSRVRYRVDGMLHTSLNLPGHIHPSVISRIKVLANLKLDETRIPQDGRITLNIDKQKIDFRVSTMPLLNKEKAVLRILEGSEAVPTLKDLGFSDYQIRVMEANIKRSHGFFLVTGPTGSGKSTTIYSVLNILNQDQVNIATLEDPIEFYLEGVNQSQIRPEVKFTFASGLRSLLRQDPNIIMVGEIRDSQTAEMAIHASLTGHLIFSTLHTNDSLGAVPRLIDMKVEPFLLASTLNIVVAQRLTRKICQACKEQIEIPDYLLKNIMKEFDGIDKDQLPQGLDISHPVFYHGRGCDLCQGSGYHGRVAIAEILSINDEIKRLIVSGYNIDEVKKEMRKQKMLTLMQAGLLRAAEGLTTVEEVLRVIQE
ncbi:MAG: GspE/PulE family protein [Patescibacteria group bacterium]|jgi:type IV pilus assembly protein PilB